MSNWLERLRDVKRSGADAVGAHATRQGASTPAPPEIAPESGGRDNSGAGSDDKLPRLPWQLERLLDAAKSNVLGIELPGVDDTTRYTLAWGCAYLTGDRDEALKRLWQVYRQWQGVN